MGTNYYWHSNPCSTCGHSEQEIHIGKSSAGWCFSLCVYREPWEELLPKDFNDWMNFFKSHSGVIKNEYGEIIPLPQMIDIITNRNWEPDRKSQFPNHFYKSLEDFYAKNHACPGPNNLCRHILDDRCVGHGEGTYDYIVGEFS